MADLVTLIFSEVVSSFGVEEGSVAEEMEPNSDLGRTDFEPRLCRFHI